MGLAVKILAPANFIAAIVLFYFVGKDFAARQNWMQLIDRRIEVRDGLLKTDGVVDKSNALRDTLARGEGLNETEKEYVAHRLREWENLKSEYSRRKLASEFLLSSLPRRPDVILSQENQTVAAELGADDYRKVLREFRVMYTPRLQTEELLLLEQKDALLQAQKGYDQHIADLKVKIAKLGTRDQKPDEIIEAEKAIKKKLDEENDMRRKELAGLYTELEEQCAARNVAQGRERDMRDLLALTRRQIDLLTKENQDIANRMKQKEGVQIGQK